MLFESTAAGGDEETAEQRLDKKAPSVSDQSKPLFSTNVLTDVRVGVKAGQRRGQKKRARMTSR